MIQLCEHAQIMSEMCKFIFGCKKIKFLFQAEDGIRDAKESRGLGDVYKRQLVEM